MLQSVKNVASVILVDKRCVHCAVTDEDRTFIRDGLSFPFRLSLCYSQWSLFQPR